MLFFFGPSSLSPRRTKKKVWNEINKERKEERTISVNHPLYVFSIGGGKFGERAGEGYRGSWVQNRPGGAVKI